MATAFPLSFVAPVPASPPAPLPSASAEDEAYAASFLAFCEEEDAREPGVIDLEIATARAYAGDAARELADIEAGRHPLQRAPR